MSANTIYEILCAIFQDYILLYQIILSTSSTN